MLAGKNFAMAVELKRIKQYINELFLIDSIEQYISAGMHAVAEFIPVLRTLAKWLGKQRTLWQVLGTALLVYYANIIKTTLVTVANTTATLAQKAAYQLGYYWLVVSQTATKAYALAQAVLTGQITLATAATRIWNAALNANPLGVVITLMSALVGALRLYSDNTKEAIALERKKRDLMVLLKETTDENTKAQQSLNDRVNEYTNLSKDQ